MKGIILSGGSGTRLYPATKVLSKQLLNVYDKPMIYYPMSILMLAGIREILIISTERDLPLFKELFTDGSHLGLSIQYKSQAQPNGIAEAFVIGREFIADDSVCLILGDNIFYGQGVSEILDIAKKSSNAATIFGYRVQNPSDFGVANIKNEKVLSIEEKPLNPRSNLAIPGLYFYPNDVLKKVTKLERSSRGEFEITSLNKIYLKENRLNLIKIGRGIAWLDTGNPESLLRASEFISIIQERQSTYIACLEEIAYRRGFISLNQLEALGTELKNSAYGKYILSIMEEIE
jgi:glucose-1-phosphate thymidylyltransferase